MSIKASPQAAANTSKAIKCPTAYLYGAGAKISAASVQGSDVSPIKLIPQSGDADQLSAFTRKRMECPQHGSLLVAFCGSGA